MSRIDRLTRRLVLEERRNTPDGSGGLSVVWEPLGTLWAEVVPRSAREDFLAGVIWPRVRYRILVRGAPVGASSRPRLDQRLREGDRLFGIIAVTEHDRAGRYLEITAEEGVMS